MRDHLNRGKDEPSLLESLEMTELGFSVAVERREDLLRGHFDASRLERDHPQLVRLVVFCLGLDMDWDAIGIAAGMTWMSVKAIAERRAESIKEFKVRNASQLRVILDAGRPHLLRRFKDGKFTPLDWKLVSDAFLAMAEQATVIVATRRERDPEEEALLRMLEAREVPALPAGMVPEVGNVLPMRETVDSESDSDNM